MSTSRWSQIENGYELKNGTYKLVTANKRMLAHMAHLVHLTPKKLEEDGRADAAEILTEILRRQKETAPEAADVAVIREIAPGPDDRKPFPVEPEMKPYLEPHVQEISGLVGMARLRWDSGALTGEQVFGTGRRGDARKWDFITAQGYQLDEKGYSDQQIVQLVATLIVWAEQQRTAEQDDEAG